MSARDLFVGLSEAGVEWERIARACMAMYDWSTAEKRAINDFILAVRFAAGDMSPAPALLVHGVTWLLFRDGMVLLEKCPKKARVLGVGEWFVPGGKVEGNEHPLAALTREVAEEWGVTVTQKRELPIVEGSAVPPGPRGTFLMRPFVIEVDGVVPAVTSEGTPLRWTPVEEAIQSPVPQVRMMMAAAHRLESAGYGDSDATGAAQSAAEGKSGLLGGDGWVHV